MSALQRFVAAQEDVYETALAELIAGRKRSHWMWFIFPQLAGLGHSEMARIYAIGSLDEAQAYLDHPLLGARLRACIAAILRHADRSAESILGDIDALKFRSSMTLFDAVEPGADFARALDAFCGGGRDERTQTLLAA